MGSRGEESDLGAAARATSSRRATDSERSESSVRLEAHLAIRTHDSFAYRLTRCAWHPQAVQSSVRDRVERQRTQRVTQPIGDRELAQAWRFDRQVVGQTATEPRGQVVLGYTLVLGEQHDQ